MMALAILGAFLVGIGSMYLITIMFPDGKCYTPMQVRRMFDELYKEIEHGDKDHKIWLWEKINQFLERKGLR